MGTSSPFGPTTTVATLIPLGEVAVLLAIGVLAWTAHDVGRIIGASSFAIGLSVYLITCFPMARLGNLGRELVALVGGFGGLALLRAADVTVGGEPIGAASAGLVACLLGVRVSILNRRAIRHREAIDLASPFPEGGHMVLQGGCRTVNHHATVEAQCFALDVLRTRPIGPPTRRLRARQLDDFISYGERLVSPLDGTVVAVVDQRPDLGEPVPASGNCVTIEPDGRPGWRVVLAHLVPGSPAVATGERVLVGQAIGSVGNSGNSTEPHLHIHVEDEQGHGVPMRFGGRRPLHRNDTIGTHRGRGDIQRKF